MCVCVFSGLWFSYVASYIERLGVSFFGIRMLGCSAGVEDDVVHCRYVRMLVRWLQVRQV